MHWHINGTHYLEQWGDTRAFDGTASLIQPLIAPLYNGKSEYEFIFSLIGSSETAGYDMVRKYWQGQMKGGDFDSSWRKALNDGFIANTALPAKTITPKGGNIPASTGLGANAMEVMFRRDPLIYDGSRANNAWLQETPKPVMNLCWDNAVLISPNQANKSGLVTGDVVEIDVNGRKVKGPIWPQPGHPDNAITVFLGYGRTKSGNVGTSVGFDGYKLRSSDAPSFADDNDQES